MEIKTDVKLRKSVVLFAENMETTLRANDHKSGWENESDNYLDTKLIEEVCEYLTLNYSPLEIMDLIIDQLQRAQNAKADDVLQSKRSEILDVGAVAMMIFDNTEKKVRPHETEM